MTVPVIQAMTAAVIQAVAVALRCQDEQAWPSLLTLTLLWQRQLWPWLWPWPLPSKPSASEQSNPPGR